MVFSKIKVFFRNKKMTFKIKLIYQKNKIMKGIINII